MSTHDDEIFVRNFALVLVGLFVVAIIATLLAKTVNSFFQDTQDRDDILVGRIAPVGRINTGSESIMLTRPHLVEEAPSEEAVPVAEAGSTDDPGKAVYDGLCFTCHAQGIAGAPKMGDMAAWEARVEKGRDVNVSNVINGYTGSTGVMPPKGGNPSLSDEEIAAAVDYMLATVGAGNASANATSAPVTASEPEPVAAAAVDNAKGKEVYDAACFVCHTPGAAGAPKLGDAAAWGPRIEKGIDSLYHNSIRGYMGEAGMMPPKGGRPDFSDEDVKAAVDYMVSSAQ